MASDRHTTKAVRNESTADDLELGPLQMVAIRTMTLVIEIIGRVLDVLVLLARPRLLWPYLRVWGAELWRSPYKWPRSFEAHRVVKSAGQTLRELMYGEVLLGTAVYLMARAGVGRSSVLVDVGAGRGRALLAARWLGARARGIELWEPHVMAVGPALRSAGAELETGDAAQADLSEATHVLLNWCAFTPETQVRLTERFKATCRPGTRFIAVTRPVEDPAFQPVSRHLTLFSWGFERVTVQELRAPPPRAER
jgi:hypothetical protein